MTHNQYDLLIIGGGVSGSALLYMCARYTESKIDGGNGNIYNVTPSPGGTSCLENAEKDMRVIAAKLGATIDEELLQRELFDT